MAEYYQISDLESVLTLSGKKSMPRKIYDGETNTIITHKGIQYC